MKARGVFLFAVTLATAGCLGCASSRKPPTLVLPPSIHTIEEHILYSATTWSGSVRLVRPLVVTKSATLTILPGTTVFFDIPAPAADKDRQPWILILGSLLALGTPEAPITLASTEIRQNDLDDMIQILNAKESHVRNCFFERGPWALHVHETRVDVTSTVFRGNFGGVRFQGDRIVLRGNRFEQNTIAVRCLKASPVLEENSFVGNLTGIFFREGVVDAVIRRNNFDDVEYEIKLGENQASDVDASQNWWKDGYKGLSAARIYDSEDASGLGRVHTDSPLPTPWGEPERKR